jgi:coenzyme F420-reducing hydrogenase beta subunit
VEFSGILRSMRGDGGKWAIVCLPCVAYALSRLRGLDEGFSNITQIICLTCGHNKTMKYLDAILSYYGLEPPYRSIRFRRKGDYPVSQYALYVEDCKGKKIEEHFDNGVINVLWCHYYFSQKACLGCRDTFGRDADMTAMDAWLHPYSASREGYNFIGVTKQFTEQHLNACPNISCTPLSPVDVIASQQVIVQRKMDGLIPNEYRFNHLKAEELLLSGRELKKIVAEACAKTRSPLFTRIKSKLASLLCDGSLRCLQ